MISATLTLSLSPASEFRLWQGEGCSLEAVLSECQSADESNLSSKTDCPVSDSELLGEEEEEEAAALFSLQLNPESGDIAESELFKLLDRFSLFSHI